MREGFASAGPIHLLGGKPSQGHARPAKAANPLPPPGKSLPPPAAKAANAAIPARRPQTGTPIARNRPNIGMRTVHMGSNSLFGVHGAALQVRSQRMGVLASNIANASTPGFKAKDIDFREALNAIETPGMAGTDPIGSATKYRVPLQPSLDGNTVELATEQTAFAENAVAYQTTLAFLNGRIDTLKRALKGE
jgi:flagellar basal-body rod protein FlgB